MIAIDQIKKGSVYGNGKGMYRKVKDFTQNIGKTEVVKQNPFGSDIHYAKCDEHGNEKGKELSCWCSTFAAWAKEEVSA